MERLGWVTVGAIFGASVTVVAIRLLNLQDEEAAPARYQPGLGSGREDAQGASARKPEMPMTSKPIVQPESDYTAPPAQKTNPK